MFRSLVAGVVAVQLAGCFTYALRVDEPERETIAIFAAADIAVGTAVGVSLRLSDNSLGSLGEDVLAGVLTALVVDLAIGLGVTAGDFVSEAHR